MNKIAQNLADQLRAGALQIAEQAETIVGDLDLNMYIDVTIHLSSSDAKIAFPSIEIRREIASKPMNEVMFRGRLDKRKE